MSVNLILHDKPRETDVGQNKGERKAQRWFLKQHKFSRQILDSYGMTHISPTVRDRRDPRSRKSVMLLVE